MTNATRPLMPKATAVWLVENTALTFEQIAEFCDLHMLEVKGIADGDVAQGIRGKDPITGGELTRDEIRKGEEDQGYKLKLSKAKVELPPIKTKKAARYTPTSRRQDRPNAIVWLVKFHPELKDSQIIKMVGTTKPTIQQIRDRTHWNSPNLVPQDPVALGLCSQTDLDTEVQKAAARVRKELEASGQPIPEAGTLASAAETTGYNPLDPSDLTYDPASADQPSVDMNVFGEGAQDAGPPTLEATESAEEAQMMEQLRRMSSSEQPGTEQQPDLDEQPSIDDVFAAEAPQPTRIAETSADAPQPEIGDDAFHTSDDDAELSAQDSDPAVSSDAADTTAPETSDEPAPETQSETETATETETEAGAHAEADGGPKG